jgi:hypothetical protein
VFCALGAFNIAALAEYSNRYSIPDSALALGVFVIILLFMTALGFFLLILGKKIGIFLLSGSGLIDAILSLVAETFLAAAICFVIPILTSLIVAKRWAVWDEIFAARKAAHQQQIVLVKGQLVTRGQVAAAKAQVKAAKAQLKESLRHIATQNVSQFPAQQGYRPLQSLTHSIGSLTNASACQLHLNRGYPQQQTMPPQAYPQHPQYQQPPQSIADPQQAPQYQVPPMPQQIPTYPQYQPVPQQMAYWIRGRRMKIWAIVNTCFFFPFVAPIIAIIMSAKAQRASSEQQFKLFYRWALILNIGTYLIPIIIVLIRTVVIALTHL